jgi:flagellar biosynthesis protein FlhG
MAAKIWVTGAGKGGVGKTFVSSSLGITLSKLNHRVLLIDFDLSGANLHTTFGENPSSKNLSSYFKGEAALKDLHYGTQIPRLSLVQGFWDSWSPTNISTEQVQKMVQDCRELPFDYVLFDLGPGPSLVHLELFFQADERILISNSEPTSVEKNYRFIEAFICHSLKESSTPESFGKLEHTLRSYRGEKKKGFFSFRKYLSAECGFDFNFFEQLQKKPLRLIVNESRSRLDQDLGHSIKSVCNKYFDLSIDYVGCIDFDNAVWQSVKSREPVLIDKPFTPLAGQFLTICKQMTNSNSGANYYRAVV